RAVIEGGLDWSTAECLSIGSLLWTGQSIRFAGQDSQRGTFSQRHMIWIDTETGLPYSPLKNLKQGQGRIDVVNSPLTEFGGLGFEYGYTWGNPEAFVLWEAQYGDFDNGAQIIIDQYIVSAEHKWNYPSSLTLLLPHAYEGAGPEHSSARLERFLQLAARFNIQVVNASTPAQYFHLLQRQARRKIKKPLVVFTPKSLLRAPVCTSKFAELTKGCFEEILDDPTPPASCKRLIFCSGKVFYDLAAERTKRGKTDTALVRIEQLYPLHIEKLQKIMVKYKGLTECFWVQEEPENMG
ncbi:MAG: 2-oxoglutarate dehydrogenase subunit E1, partial [Chlamydiota bacterium]